MLKKKLLASLSALLASAGLALAEAPTPANPASLADKSREQLIEEVQALRARLAERDRHTDEATQSPIAAEDAAAQPKKAPASVATPAPAMTVAPFVDDVAESAPAQRRVYATADALWLQRDRPGRVNLTQDTSNNGTIVLTTDDLHFNDRAGTRLTLGAFVTDSVSIEGVYLGGQNWHSQAISPNSPGQTLNAYFTSNGILGTDVNSSFHDDFLQAASYSSRFDNAEINGRYWLNPNASVLVGVRFVSIDEEFSLLTFDNPKRSARFGDYDVKTGNDLLGLQTGGDVGWSFLSDRVQVGARGKGGLFLNFAEQQSRFTNNRDAGPSFDLLTKVEGTHYAAVLDMGVFTSVRLMNGIFVRAGYDVIYVNGLALAPANLDSMPQMTDGRRTLVTNGSTVFHGPSVGLDIRW